jgi:hypothetical protein
MDWGNEKALELIVCYKNKSVLWFPKNQKYTNTFSKSNTWEDLPKEIITTPDECKKKIISLNASFLRERRR